MGDEAHPSSQGEIHHRASRELMGAIQAVRPNEAERVVEIGRVVDEVLVIGLAPEAAQGVGHLQVQVLQTGQRIP